MTDIIYPSHPDLTGMPTEFVPSNPAVNKPAEPMANPYQVQRLINPVPQQPYPPQNYPQGGQPQPAPTQPVPTQPVASQPISEQSVQPQAVSDANLLQDVTWSNFNAVAVPAPQVAPQSAPYSAPQSAPYSASQSAPYSASQPAPQTALNAAPSSAYPPMPTLQASGLQAASMAAAFTPSIIDVETDNDAAPLEVGSNETGSKSLLGSIKQRLASRPKKNSSKKDMLAEQTPNAGTENWTAPNMSNPNISSPNVPNIAKTDNLAEMAHGPKKPRSSRITFLLGLLSGLVLAFVLFAGLDLIAQKKEYATVAAESLSESASAAAASTPQLEKLNDDLVEIPASKDELGGLFLDEQLNPEN